MPWHGTGITEAAEVRGLLQDIAMVAQAHTDLTEALLPQEAVAPTDEVGP